MRRSSLLCVLVLASGCLGQRAFACDADEQCLQSAAGVCEADQWCSYPSDACDSGRAYGPHAPDGVAGSCVKPVVAEGSTGDGDGADDGDESGSDGTPVPRCGDGTVDPGEDCDDGNRLPGDGCHPQCVEPGTPAWTATFDGDAHGEDRGFGLAVDAAADAIYVAGLSAGADTERDIMIQRWRLATGELQWTRVIDGGALAEDIGEHVAVDSAGNVVVVGMLTTEATGPDAWVAKYNPQGDQLWVETFDRSGLADKAAGVAIGDGDRIIAVGHSEDETRTDAWMQWYTTDGVAEGPAIYRGEAGFSEAIDVIADGDEFQVTGSLRLSTDEQVVWTARYAADGSNVWEHQLTNADVGNAPRGVGQDFDPLGGSAIAGVVSNDLLLQRYDDAGVPTTSLAEDGPQGSHDEAADVAFSSDGTFVVVGFLDFSTTGFATSDSIVRRHEADGTLIWGDRFEGEAAEIDKALGVEVTQDLSAVVVGYETVPGQSRDVWLRRYAL
ncbi:MAG: DUF4215 domain-containing protein [Myxococcota bacterium]